MATDWDEIKRLAADFQKAQLSSTSQRLSERNCIEVVTLLISKGILDVIYTIDGKEYLTPQQLETEIRDELYLHGGRVNLIDLSKILNVDFHKINTVAEKIKEDAGIHFLLGQLIETSYIERIALEINEKLSQCGELNVSELTIAYDLPSDFLLHEVMEKYLGTIIQGRQDNSNARIFFTQSYLTRSRAKIRGAVCGLTKPTPVAAILSHCSLQERIFHSLLNEIKAYGFVTSRLPGAQYIPHIYNKTQIEWVNTNYSQNGFLEYDSLSELGITDIKTFLQNHLPNVQFKFLNKCAVSSRITEQCEAALEECISTNSYLDISTILPSVMGDDDIEKLLSIVITPQMQKSVLIFGSNIITIKFLDEIVKPCYDIVKEKAKTAVDSGSYQQYMAEKMMRNQDVDISVADNKTDKRDERRKKAAGGKGGGGTQGRETKTKSTKKHNRSGGNKGGNDSDSDEEQYTTNKKKGSDKTLELVQSKEIETVLLKPLEVEGIEYLAKKIANYYHPHFSKLALTTAHEFYESSLQNSTQNRRQTHTVLQDKLNNLINDIRLYDKGMKLLSSDLQPHLVKYLLKSLGTDICNEICLYVAGECNLNYNVTTLTLEQRTKISQECSAEYKQSLNALIKSLTGTSVDDFLIAAEKSLQSCSMILKKIDKKKDRTLILCHKHGLLDQLANCNDPALVLHLAVLIIFTISTQNMLHASGRHVSSILSYLQPVLSSEQAQSLMQCHDLVMKLLSADADTDAIKANLDSLLPTIKEIATSYKKVGVVAAE